ncbi:MAG: DUF11 domain-containing protein, partial [Flavobacteriales bacterium]|nr:DUF11 domain-containing protein [Flavobacteriales bacterium]
DPPLATEGWSDVLTCSYDPNDKQVAPVGMGIEGWIPTETEWLDYTIRFQNTGNDTATLVVIEDQLPATVQWGTLAIQGASHTLTSISINPFGKATFAFDDIHLPDSGANELASHGFVRFRIRPQAGLTDGTIISNNAGILFDANPGRGHELRRQYHLRLRGLHRLDRCTFHRRAGGQRGCCLPMVLERTGDPWWDRATAGTHDQWKLYRAGDQRSWLYRHQRSLSVRGHRRSRFFRERGGCRTEPVQPARTRPRERGAGTE